MTTYPGDDPQTPDDPQDPASRPPEDDVPAPQVPGRHRADPAGGVLGATRQRAGRRAGTRPGWSALPHDSLPAGRAGVQPDQPRTPTASLPGTRVRTPRIPTPRPPTHRTPTRSPARRRTAGSQLAPDRHPASRLRMPRRRRTAASWCGPRTIPRQRSRWCWDWSVWSARSSSAACRCWSRRSPGRVGHSALKDIRASQGRIGGESQARTGMILGIVGTALLILAVVVLILIIVAAIASDPSSTTGSSV